DEITPGVDAFTVKVTRRSDGGESKTVVIIHRNPTTLEPPTECSVSNLPIRRINIEEAITPGVPIVEA
ncbi:unnamed protein product, partial [Allacma fusca]